MLKTCPKCNGTQVELCDLKFNWRKCQMCVSGWIDENDLFKSSQEKMKIHNQNVIDNYFEKFKK